METRIIVNLQVEGFHNWPNCDLPEVEFLKNQHRHIFHIKVKKNVFHEDRDIEIILLKRRLMKYLQKTFGYSNKVGEPLFFEDMSCESIANHLVKKFQLNYCEVLEDGENGAEVIAG